MVQGDGRSEPEPGRGQPEPGRGQPRPYDLVIVLGLAAAARIWTLGDKNIWIDEGASWTEASYPFREMLASVAGDIHPPLYYLLLKGWMAIAGDGAIAMRLPSVISGVLVVLLGWRLAVRWLDRPVALGVAIWLALSPHLVFFSQEARMYAPATALVLAMCLAYRRWLESQFSSRGMLALFTLAAIAAIYMHYFTALVLLALWIHLAYVAKGWPTFRSAPWKHWLTAHVVILLAYVPWIAVAAAQITRGQSWRQPAPLWQWPAHLAVLLKDFVIGYHVGWSVVLIASVALLAVVLLLTWRRLLVETMRHRREGDLFLVMLCGVPIAVSLLALPITGHMQLSRYLTYVMPLMIIGIARGSSFARRAWARPAAVLTIGVIASLPWLLGYYREPIRDFDVRPVVAALAAESSRENGRDRVVLLHPGFMAICFKYYAREAPARFERVSPGADIWQVLRAATQAHAGPVWLVVARTALEFDRSGIPAGLRLEEIALEPSRPDRIRLLRVQNAVIATPARHNGQSEAR